MGDTDDDVADILLFHWFSSSRKKRKRIWVHDILKSRKRFGEFHHLVRELYTHDDKFYSYFRMTSTQFEEILSLIDNDIRRVDTNYREAISPRERLAICLRFLATGDSYGTIAFSYRVGKSTVSDIVAEACSAIWQRMQPIYMPQPTKDQWAKIAEGFEHRWQFPNCIGAIDGKHVLIKAPPSSGSLYSKSKKTFSIVLLALVDHNYCFSVVDVGAYGSNSDGGIFRKSIIGQKVVNGTLDLPEDRILTGAAELGPMPHVLVGDEAFPITTNLMRPIPGRALSDEQRIFNYRLSRARRISENAFGILASRWTLYHRKLPLDPSNVDLVVQATCILHNMLQSSHIDSNKHFPTFELDTNVNMDGILRDITRRGCHAPMDALTVRNKFKDYFSSAAGSLSWQRQYCFGHVN